MVVVCELLTYQHLKSCTFLLSNVLPKSGILIVRLAIEIDKEGVVEEA